MSTVSEWRERHLTENGAIVVVDNDPRERRLKDIADNLPRGCRELGSLRSGVVRPACARQIANWLTGPWGQCAPRRKARTKYLVIYC